ncbi:MAG: hypothetical protein V9H26_04950 [Verrucomicrobiota bacterium]
MTNAQVLLSWPATITNLTLVVADSPMPTNWVAVTNTPFALDGKAAVLLAPAGQSQFFRLQISP